MLSSQGAKVLHSPALTHKYLTNKKKNFQWKNTLAYYAAV
jgi:hypothetical protein